LLYRVLSNYIIYGGKNGGIIRMPKKAQELKVTQINVLSEGFHAVGGVPGLYLSVRNKTSRSWIMRINIAGKRKEIGLGSYPLVSLSDARDQARTIISQVKNGINPFTEKEKNKDKLLPKFKITFKQCAVEFVKLHQGTWRNDKHLLQWNNTLKNYVYPIIGEKSINEIGTKDLVLVLAPIWEKIPETANRVKGRLIKILEYADAKNLMDENFNIYKINTQLTKLLPQNKRKQLRKHHPAMPFEEIPDFIKKLRQLNSVGSLALEFLILTAARSGEVRLAKRDEIDIVNKIWIIPRERMKAGKEHRIPLSTRSIEILNKTPKFESNFIFPNSKGGALSDVTLSKTLHQIIKGFTVHGFRSTFTDWRAENTNYSNEVSEMALAHTIKNQTEASYRRGDLLNKRVSLMQDWADYIG